MPEICLMPVTGGEGLVVSRDRRGWRVAPAAPGRSAASLALDPRGCPQARRHTTVTTALWPRPLAAGRPPRRGHQAWLLGSWVDGEETPTLSRPTGFVRVDNWLLLTRRDGAPLPAFPLAWAHALAGRESEPTLYVDAGPTTVLSAAGHGRVWPRLSSCPGPEALLRRLREGLGPTPGRGAEADLPGALLESWLAAVAGAAAAFALFGVRRVELCGLLPKGAMALGNRLGLPVSRARAGARWRGPEGWWLGAAGAAWRRAGRLHLGGAG